MNTIVTQVLVVDDDKFGLAASVRILAKAGFEVAQASGGLEALRLTRELRPKLVLLDVMLPDMPGTEVLRNIKADPELGLTSVVMLSPARISSKDMVMGLDGGADDYIVRPISNQELLARVNMHLRAIGLHEALRASEARFRELIADQADAVLVVDQEGIVQFANRSAEALLSRQEEELVGASIGYPIGSSAFQEITIHRPGGLPLACVEMSVAVTSWNGRTAMIATLRDITERKRVAEALIRSEREQKEIASQLASERERLVSAQAVAMVGSWETDLRSMEVAWSAQTHRIFETDPARFRPTHLGFLDIVHPKDRTFVDDAFVASLGTEVPQAIEHRLLMPDGRIKIVEQRWQVFKHEDGKPVRAVGTCRDITLHSLLEEQLRQSQRMESVGQLTGGVAHDFNNLLTVILGNAELLSEELEVDTRLSPLARLIVEAAERGAQLTQRMLAFARRQPLAPVAVDVNGLIGGMDGLLRRTLGEHVEIGFVRGVGLSASLVDPAQLERALLNLCINSRDAMPDGGHLTIETSNAQLDEDYTAQHVDVQPGEYVLVAVSDTGCGIATEDLLRVFEPFYTTKPKGKGTGLGLSMVYGFVKQSRGHVTIYSEPGKGTTVKMYLPRTSMDEEAAKVRPAGASRGGAETILLVEDDELVRRYASEQLRSLGYMVIDAVNGAEALKIVKQHGNIDLLFTDVVMPGMSGRELADAAQRLRPGLKVLYTSGYTESAIVHHGRLDSGVQLLSKPYRRAELADKVRTTILDEEEK